MNCRKRKGSVRPAQVRRGEKGQFGGGPDNYDGRANKNAGTPKPVKPESAGPAKVVKW